MLYHVFFLYIALNIKGPSFYVFVFDFKILTGFFFIHEVPCASLNEFYFVSHHIFLLRTKKNRELRTNGILQIFALYVFFFFLFLFCIVLISTHLETPNISFMYNNLSILWNFLDVWVHRFYVYSKTLWYFSAWTQL